MLQRSVRMHLIVLVCSMALSALGQAEDDWIDPYDLLNYDAATKAMKKPNLTVLSQQPTCNPVFRRFLTRLLKEIERVGQPTDHKDVHYDAKVRLSKQAVMEIRKLLEGEDSWRTGALDDAVSQILVDFKPHDYEAWRWHFEDIVGVEVDTVLKVCLCVLVVVAIICTQLWSVVSWFVQFKRMFAISFFVSVVWNWFYLYKVKIFLWLA
uniref:Chloride channel CLIC-like protein 1 n=1 Tax=Myripristis murdjan TaxID=586833 RepID=A0A667XHV7_9TELE